MTIRIFRADLYRQGHLAMGTYGGLVYALIISGAIVRVIDLERNDLLSFSLKMVVSSLRVSQDRTFTSQ